MTVPTYDRFIEPILRYLAEHSSGVPARDVHEAAAQALQVSDVDKLELLPSGSQPIYKNRAGWAHDRLERAGLSSSPRRGFWQLTPKGAEYAQAHAEPLRQLEIEQLARDYMEVLLRPAAGDGAPNAATLIPGVTATPATVSPDDRLGLAIVELRAAVASELLETLATVSPSFFETIVLDLLHRMGYGASRADLQRVGGSGDGGIDGVISLDKLGLEKVYVQAKRWQGTVGRPEVQGFYGALAGQRANKGVFITTSGYTQLAIDFAKSVERVVLIDGHRLVELMMDHDVGVSGRTVSIPKFDSDYFDEEST